MNTKENQTVNEWAEEWLTSVANGSNTMSQRKLSSVTKHGGIESVKGIAQQKGVHLLQVTDDKGVELIAASTQPFMVIC